MLYIAGYRNYIFYCQKRLLPIRPPLRHLFDLRPELLHQAVPGVSGLPDFFGGPQRLRVQAPGGPEPEVDLRVAPRGGEAAPNGQGVPAAPGGLRGRLRGGSRSRQRQDGHGIEVLETEQSIFMALFSLFY